MPSGGGRNGCAERINKGQGGCAERVERGKARTSAARRAGPRPRPLRHLDLSRRHKTGKRTPPTLASSRRSSPPAPARKTAVSSWRLRGRSKLNQASELCLDHPDPFLAAPAHWRLVGRLVLSSEGQSLDLDRARKGARELSPPPWSSQGSGSSFARLSSRSWLGSPFRAM